MDFLASLGVQDSTDYSKLDGQVITEEANRHLLGKPLHHIGFPKETQPSSCVARTGRLFNCEFWFIRGPVREHGFQVVLEADVQGEVRSAKVTDLHRWFGYRF